LAQLLEKLGEISQNFAKLGRDGGPDDLPAAVGQRPERRPEQVTDAHLRINPSVALEKQRLNMIGNLF
jgi:hypothetical protein